MANIYHLKLVSKLFEARKKNLKENGEKVPSRFLTQKLQWL